MAARPPRGDLRVRDDRRRGHAAGDGAGDRAITGPQDGTDLPKGATEFTAQASDAHDGALTGAAVAWRGRYTPDGGTPQHRSLGTGERVTATLYAGAAGTAHTITATATNSAGTARSATITVTAH